MGRVFFKVLQTQFAVYNPSTATKIKSMRPSERFLNGGVVRFGFAAYADWSEVLVSILVILPRFLPLADPVSTRPEIVTSWYNLSGLYCCIGLWHWFAMVKKH